MAPLIVGLGYDWAIGQDCEMHRRTRRAASPRSEWHAVGDLFDSARDGGTYAAANHHHLQAG